MPLLPVLSASPFHGPAVSHFSALFRGFAMEIGGFQVQPTLRPEDVVVAGIFHLCGWWCWWWWWWMKWRWFANRNLMQDAYSYLHSFLYSNTTHICIYIEEMKDIRDTLQTRPPKRASTNLWTTTVLGNTWKYSTWVWDHLGISTVSTSHYTREKTEMKMEKITMFSLNQRYSTSSNCCFFQPVIFVFRSISDGIGSWRFWGIWTLKNRNNQKQLIYIYIDVATTSHLFLYTRACSLRLPQKVGFTHMNTYDILHKVLTKDVWIHIQKSFDKGCINTYSEFR